MYDATEYKVLITYHVGSGYDAAPMKQLSIQLSDYSEEEARSQVKRIMELNPDIERYLVNITI